MKTLVVPTIREKSISEFLEVWSYVSDWDQLIIVEDNPTKTFDLKLKENQFHYSWEDIEHDLGENAWIISRRDSAIRSYGFWKAYQKGADFIFTLDDDCYPSGEFFCERHIKRLTQTTRWESSISGEKLRGIPYHNLGIQNNIMFNMGLWIGVPDYDSIRSLAEGIPDNFKPNCSDRLIPHGQYIPFCGMNFSFKREAAPLTYFPLMGKNSPYGRFDDIWFGIIAKKICDHLGLLISVGSPYIHHKRASNPFANLVKEAPGIRDNETFWETIDKIQLTGNTISSCMEEIGIELSHNKDDYLSKLGTAIKIWIKLF